VNGSPVGYRPETYEWPSAEPSTGYDRSARSRPEIGDEPGYSRGGFDAPVHDGFDAPVRDPSGRFLDNPGGTDLDEPWPGASAPPRRRPAPTGQVDLDEQERFSRSRRGPAGREPDRTRPGQFGGLAGVRALVTERTGLGRGPSVREETRRPEPATALQAAISAGTEVVVVLGMALALSLVIKTFLVQAFFIPSQSMQDTLQIGDRVLVSKLTPGPFSLHRGDVVVFKDPGGWLEAQPEQPKSPVRRTLTAALTFVGLLPQDSGEHLIKRIIGLPGDTVECCDAQGRITVNGTPIDETYVRANNKPSTEPFKVTIGPDRMWVLGDNRGQSLDSRFHRDRDDGQVPMKNVVGKAFVIVWPFSRASGIGAPSAVFARVSDAAPPGAK
jgi:signal peptidase I